MVALNRFLAAGVVFAGAIACGGTQFTPSPSSPIDGGDSSSPDANMDATVAACTTPPAATADESSFCDTESAIFNHCAPCEACRQTNLNNCVALGDSLSATFKGALGACSDQIGCGGFTTYASGPCVRAKLASASPTAAQAGAKAQYCAACTTSLDLVQCNTYFNPPTVNAGSGGVGFVVLLASDAIANAVATACSTTCGAVAYYTCALGQFCKTQGADACGSGYCGN